MAALTITRGIVLSKYDFREADRLYSVFTRDHGKLELIGRGARKPLAKLASHLEFVCEADFFIVHGKTFETVAGVERQTLFSGIYEDTSKMVLTHQSLSCLDLLIKPKQVDGDLYVFLFEWLVFVDSCPVLRQERSGFLLAAFLGRCIAVLGHEPELYACLECRCSIASGSYAWHALRGGVVCRSCLDHHQEQWFSARGIQDDTLKLLRFILKHPFSDWLHPRLSSNILSEFHDIIESFLLTHTSLVPTVSLRDAICV